jgi:hypothetical protein
MMMTMPVRSESIRCILLHTAQAILCIICICSSSGGGERAPRSQRVGGRSMAFDSKPGDWNCAECGITVFASKQQCFRCRAYKPAAARADGAPARGSKMGRREQSVDFSREEGENFDMRDARKRDLLASSRGLPQSRSISYTYTYIHTHIIHTHILMFIHPSMRTYITYIHTYIHT